MLKRWGYKKKEKKIRPQRQRIKQKRPMEPEMESNKIFKRNCQNSDININS